MKAPALDIHVESELWERRPDAVAIVARAAAAVAAETAFRPDDEIGVLLVDDAAILALNARWRDQAKPTNVLSFPAPRSVAPGAPCFLGDIVLAFETIEREARAEGKTMDAHLAHLTVHGILHLRGHDHEAEAEAQAMERLETRILAALGIADPYAALAD